MTKIEKEGTTIKMYVKFLTASFNFPRYFKFTIDQNLSYQKTMDLVGLPSYRFNDGISICVALINKCFLTLIKSSN